MHDPVVAGRACKDAAADFARFTRGLRVRLLALVQHVPHGAVENVTREQHALFCEHIADILTRYLLSTVRAYLPTEKTGPHMTGEHYEGPRVGGCGLHVVVITDIIQYHVCAQFVHHVYDQILSLFFSALQKNASL